jgi:hypothetical protein
MKILPSMKEVYCFKASMTPDVSRFLLLVAQGELNYLTLNTAILTEVSIAITDGQGSV